MDKKTLERLREIGAIVGRNWRTAEGRVVQAAARELERLDVERGKEAVAKVLVHYNYGPDYKASVEWLTDCRLVPDTPLFLSQTIPEGMALVQIEPTASVRKVLAEIEAGEYSSDTKMWQDLIAAAQGEHNAN